MSVSNVTSATDSAILQKYIAQQQATAANSAGSASSSTATSISKVTGDFNTFLKILTTQLQNQDPMNAMDSNEFTRELVQFSGVEQQINTNSKLDQIISLYKGNGITPLLSYVDKFVETPANGQIVVQNGESAFSYTLPYAAAKTVITIKDGSGSTVATMEGPTNSGVNRVVWDGKNSSGTQQADGVYQLVISATDSYGKAIGISNVNLVGRVTSLQTDSDGVTTLSIGSVKIKASDVTAVYSGGTKSG